MHMVWLHHTDEAMLLWLAEVKGPLCLYNIAVLFCVVFSHHFQKLSHAEGNVFKKSPCRPQYFENICAGKTRNTAVHARPVAVGAILWCTKARAETLRFPTEIDCNLSAHACCVFPVYVEMETGHFKSLSFFGKHKSWSHVDGQPKHK